MSFRHGALVLVLACAGCGGSSTSRPAPAFRGTPLSRAPAAPNFRLDDQAGRVVTLAGQHGHPVVVTFLYTHCPDVCPVIAGNLNRALQTSAARRAGLRVLAVSVDPAGDTPQAVRRFIRDHRLVPAFRYLIGAPLRLRRVWAAYHVVSAAGPKKTVTHSSISILVDRGGRERVVYDSTVQTGDVVHDLARIGAHP